MGFYLGYGLSLFGREQDRLSHVLVSPEFESHREFFYKPPKAQTLYGRIMVGAIVDERPISTADAKIWLAEIPFVRLRDGLTKELLEGKITLTHAVRAIQASLPISDLMVDLARHKLTCGGIGIRIVKKRPRLPTNHCPIFHFLGFSKAPSTMFDSLSTPTCRFATRNNYY
jgi:CRISPR-associated protein NE0113 (Cas_NE0113)